MARAIWAAKAQLLAQLRPFAVKEYIETGSAPLKLLPEVCSHLRGFTPKELRVILAAYAKHPKNSPALLLAPTTNNTSGRQAKEEPVHFYDVVVQQLVGGSRLGTTAQLLDAAETIAEYAPCDCRAGHEFWTVFAERMSRLSAADGLEAGYMLRIFVSCSGWEQRCGPLQSRSTRQTGGAWGHMLRSVGGRFADPRYLDTLELPDVVALARHAAQLGEPQHRLAAAIGLRVGGASAASLSAEDLIDLIGAAGKLGGKLHMMTRSLADHLEPQVPHVPGNSLVELCSHLGALEMFPQRVATALEAVLPQKVQELNLWEALQLLRACGRLRWRMPAVLEPLMEIIRAEENLDAFDGAALGCVMYELYRLDIWDENLAAAVCKRLDPEAGRRVPRKTAVNTLLALSYFSQPVPNLYKRFLHELLRTRDLPHEAIYQIKTFEMAVRVGHALVTFEELGQLATKWLFGIRKMATPPESRGESAFADDLSAVARSISWMHEAEVEIGPYVLDFTGVLEGDDESELPRGWNASKPGRSLARCCVALEADGPSHFYRPHGRPWHWTSTSKLRHKLLTASRIRVAHVPYYDWLQLEAPAQKEAYLTKLLLRAQRMEFAPLGNRYKRDDVKEGPNA